MRYRIAYDEPGRLRVRFGPDAFTQEQGYGIAALLLGRPGVREAVTCALNGSVLVCYEGEGRAEALAAEIAAAGGQTALLPGDVSDPAQAAALVRAAEELCPRVRDLCLSVQTGGGELERYLHRQYGVALRPDWAGVQAAIRFDPRAEEAGQAVLSLFGPEADLAGLAVSVPGLERQKEGQWLPLLEILWETGRLERTDLEFT